MADRRRTGATDRTAGTSAPGLLPTGGWSAEYPPCPPRARSGGEPRLDTVIIGSGPGLTERPYAQVSTGFRRYEPRDSQAHGSSKCCRPPPVRAAALGRRSRPGGRTRSACERRWSRCQRARGRCSGFALSHLDREADRQELGEEFGGPRPDRAEADDAVADDVHIRLEVREVDVKA